MFARCWLLVEGETEYWVVPELARLQGFDFAAEGVECVEFAQCGLSALTKLADHLGIAWHVLVDGDDAGQRYAETAIKARGTAAGATGRITMLRDKDIEHCFWQNGFADVIRRVAYPGTSARSATAAVSIRKAIERTSKPHLALSLIDAAVERGPQSIPAVLRETIEAVIASARAMHGPTRQQAL
jgi:putative ATP-dependent endonuclease of OLD family